MSSVRPGEHPGTSLLVGVLSTDAFADCYVTEVEGAVSQQAYIEAFYTSPLFKVERTLLKWLLGKPSTDDQVRQLAAGTVETFAAWRVESRTAEQLLLADFSGRTRSWLMVEPVQTSSTSRGTRLYFGSGVGPRERAGGGPGRMGFAFHALLGFHRLYSRLLLSAARAALARKAGRT